VSITFVSDSSQKPYATAWGPCICLDAQRLALLSIKPFDHAAVIILEELVHSLFGVAHEETAQLLTCSLFGGIVFADGEYRVEGH